MAIALLPKGLNGGRHDFYLVHNAPRRNEPLFTHTSQKNTTPLNHPYFTHINWMMV
jgi:hypothetical protein